MMFSNKEGILVFKLTSRPKACLSQWMVIIQIINIKTNKTVNYAALSTCSSSSFSFSRSSMSVANDSTRRVSKILSMA